MVDQIQNYRDLLVWQKAMDLAAQVFKISAGLPVGQRYVLASQMQRSALSVPSNIAEGRARHSGKDFVFHLNVARGSLAELETQILLCRQLNFFDPETCKVLLEQSGEVMRMLYGLRNSLIKTTKAA